MRTATLVLTLLLLPALAHAQARPRPDAPPARNLVILQLRTEVDTQRAPATLLDRLALQPSLLELEVTGTDRCREGAEAQALRRELGAGGHVETTLSGLVGR